MHKLRGLLKRGIFSVSAKLNQLRYFKYKKILSPIRYIRLITAKKTITSTIAILLLLVFVLGPLLPRRYAQGAYTASTLDTDGNAHLANDSVTDTYFYDTTTDSAPEVQQKLGVDPNWKSGVTRQSYALKYNGSSTYVNVADSSSINLSKFTFETWLKPGASSGTYEKCLVDKQESGFDKGWGVCLHSNDLYMYIATTGNGKQSALSGNGTLTAGQWYHIAISYDGVNTIKYFRDGVLIATDTTAASGSIVSTTAALRLGAYSYLDGTMDEVRLSNEVRYTGNFSPLRRYKEDTNTVGLWHFDEATGNTAYDSSMYMNNGDLTGHAPAWVTGANAIMDGYDGANGFQSTSGAGNIALSDISSTTSDKTYEIKAAGGTGLSFGGDDFARAASSSAPSLPITIEMWVKPSVSNPKGMFDTAPYVGNVFRNYPEGKVEWWNQTPAVDLGLTANEWQHIAFVFSWDPDGGEMGDGRRYLTYFKNGAIASAVAADGDGNVGWSTLTFGNINNGDDGWYTGLMDEIRISNTARYTTTFTPSRRFGVDSNTVGLWHLDETGAQTASDASGNGLDLTLGATTGASTDDPSWVDGVLSDGSDPSTIQSWPLQGYQYRKRMTVSSDMYSAETGYAVQTTEDRGVAMDNKQTRPDGKDWRVVYQPPDQYRSLSFNGGNYATIPGGYGSTIGGDNTNTISLWFYARSFDNGPVILSSTFNSGFYFWLRNNSITWYVAGSARTYTISLQTYKWYNLVAVKSGTGNNGELYLNSQKLFYYTGSIGNYPDANGDITIGKQTSAGGYTYNGDIDDVRIYDYSLSSSEIINLYTTRSIPQIGPVPSGLKAWWKLDESSGQYIRDYSGNENNGVLGDTNAVSSNDPAWATEGAVITAQEVPSFVPNGHALNLSAGGYVIITDSGTSSLDVTTGITMSGWVKWDGHNDDGPPIIMRKTIGYSFTNCVYKMSLTTDGKVVATITDGNESGGSSAAVTSTNAVTVDKWFYFTATYNKQQLKLYVDGSLAGSTPATFNIGAVDGELLFGNTTYDTVHAMIDDFRLYNRALSETELKGVMNNTLSPRNGLAGHWRFDEGSGGTVYDSSGNGNDSSGMLANWAQNAGMVPSTNQTQFKLVAPVFGMEYADDDYYLYYGNPNETSSPQSYSSYGLKFYSDEYVDMGYIDYSGYDDISISGWAYIDSSTVANDHNIIIGNADNNATNGFSISYYKPDGKVYFYYGEQSQSLSVTEDAWFNFVFVIPRDGYGAITGYINGTESDGLSATGSKNNGTTHTFIGRGATSKPWHGKLDNIKIFSRSLSSTEITGLYSNTPMAARYGLIDYWKLDDGVDPEAATVVDSIGGGNNGTLYNFEFDENSNWVLVANPIAADYEPGVSISSASAKEAPIYFQWREAGGSWSVGVPFPYDEIQLGTTGIYIRINPGGFFSRYDYYRISSWAVEAFSTGTPCDVTDVCPPRGKLRRFPEKANLIANAGGVDIIDAQTNKLWMRIPAISTDYTDALISSYDIPRSVVAKNGRIYIGKQWYYNSSIDEIMFDLDAARDYYPVGNRLYLGNIAERGEDKGFETGTGSGPATYCAYPGDKTLSVAVGNNKQYLAYGSGYDGVVQVLGVMHDITAVSPGNQTFNTYQYSRTNPNDGYRNVVLTDTGTLYAANQTQGGVDRWDNVFADTGNQVGSTDAVYTTATTPKLKSNVVHGISVSVGTSKAEPGVSNTLALATDGGSEVIEEHSTTASGTIRHYVKTGNVGSSGYSSKTIGGAADFDGSDDYIETSKDIADNTSALTVSAWVYSRTSTYAASFVAKDDTSSNRSWYFGMNDGTSIKAATWTNNGRIDATMAGFSQNTWTHVAFVYDGANITLYMNGTANSPTAQTGTIADNAVTVKIGTIAPSAYAFNGMVSDVHVYNRALSSGEINSLKTGTNVTSSLLAYWPLNERGGQKIHDESGNDYTATLGADTSVASSDPTLVSPTINGTVDKAQSVGLYPGNTPGRGLSFDGGDKVQISDADSLSPSSEVTVSSWVYPTSDSGQDFKRMVSKTESPDDGEYTLWMYNTNRLVIWYVNTWSTGGGYVVSNTALPLNQWSLVTGVFSSGSLKLYINGVFDNSGATSATSITNTSNNVYIGNTGSGDKGWVGSIDDVRIYNRVLSSLEIFNLYYYGKITSVDTGLVGNWKLDEGTGQTTIDSTTNANNGIIGATTASNTDDPTWITTTPIRERGFLWVGVNGAGADDGNLTDISLATDKQITSYTTGNSGLPDNDVISINVVNGGLALVGCETGAWNPGMAGFVVDDTSATPATPGAVNSVRVKGGTIRIKSGGTVRVKPG